METILQRLLAIDGVSGALLTGKDGLVVASTLDGEEEELLGAMAAAAYDAAGRYIEQLGVRSGGPRLSRVCVGRRLKPRANHGREFS